MKIRRQTYKNIVKINTILNPIPASVPLLYSLKPSQNRCVYNFLFSRDIEMEHLKLVNLKCVWSQMRQSIMDLVKFLGDSL